MNEAIAHLHRKGSVWTDRARPGYWPKDTDERKRLWLGFLEVYRGQGLKDGGKLTQAAKNVFHALLFEFLNLKRGQCDPSYEAIAKVARVSRRAVADAVKQLQAYGFLVWQRRRRFIRFGNYSVEVQTSNAYSFVVSLFRRGGAECKNRTGTHSNIFNNNNNGLSLWKSRLLSVAEDYDRENRRLQDAARRTLGIGTA